MQRISTYSITEKGTTYPEAASETAALISAAVASATRRFCVKIHPMGSLVVSHVLPLAVESFKFPGANVPDLRASCALPPTLAICLASCRVMALLTAAALVEAGS